MRAGDNASAPAHVGLSDSRARPVLDGTAFAQTMMVASDPSLGAPQHRQGQLFHHHGSINLGEQCRHEGCNARLQHGNFCMQHTQFDSQKMRQAHLPAHADLGDRGSHSRSPLARNVPIAPLHRPPATNGTHVPSGAPGNSSSSSPSAPSKKMLPDKMVARKSVFNLPSNAGKVGAHSSLDTSRTGNEKRPIKRQRTSDDDAWKRTPYTISISGDESAGGFGVNGHVFDGPPDQARIRESVLRDPSTAGVSAPSSQEWRPQGPETMDRQRPVTYSPSAAHSTLVERNVVFTSSGETSVPTSAPSPPEPLVNGVQKPSHPPRQNPMSQHVHSPQTIAHAPDLNQSNSALETLAKYKENKHNFSQAEINEMIRMAQSRQLPRFHGPIGPIRGTNGDYLGPAATDVVTNGQARAQEIKSSHTSPIRPAWRPSMPSMNATQGWRPGFAMIDLTQNGEDPEMPVANGLSPVDRGPSQAARSSTTSNGDIVHVDGPKGVAAQDNRPPVSAPSRQPEPSEKMLVNVTDAPTIPMPSVVQSPSKAGASGGHEDVAPKLRRPGSTDNNDVQTLAASSSKSPRSPRTVSLRIGNATEARQRRERQLEAARRAEDALRQSTAQILAGPASVPASGDTLRVNGVVNGVDDDHVMPDATVPSLSAAIVKPPEGLPEPEKRRLELVSRHDPDQMDAFIYGDLNAPCRPLSRLFHIVSEEHPPRPTRAAQHFAHIDPRLHWSRPRSRGWYEGMQAKIRDRGNKKKGLGQAASRQAKRKHEDAVDRGATGGQPMVQQVQRPERVMADPLWTAASKELDDMATQYHADERVKASGVLPEARTSKPGKPTKGAAVNGDGPVTRRSERQNTRQHDVGTASPAHSEKAAKTTPARRILRTKTASRPPVTVEDADESESSDNDEDSTWGEGSGHRLRRRGASRDDHNRMDVETTPTRLRSGR